MTWQLPKTTQRKLRYIELVPSMPKWYPHAGIPSRTHVTKVLPKKGEILRSLGDIEINPREMTLLFKAKIESDMDLQMERSNARVGSCMLNSKW